MTLQVSQIRFYEDWHPHVQEIMERRPDVSFVMPAFNEENNIMKALKGLVRVARQLGVQYEIIVVDDGSLDGTLKKVMDYTSINNCVKVVSYQKNMGKGYAIKTGFNYSKGDAVVFIDSDLEIDPGQIDRYFMALESAEMVVASKRHPESRVQIRSIRRFLSQCFNVLVRMLTGARISDTQTGLKAVRRSALEKTFSRLAVKRYAYDVELLAVASRYGIKTIELPVCLHIPTHFKLKETWRMFIDLLGIAYRLKISKYY